MSSSNVFAGRIGVVVEVAPGVFYSYVMRGIEFGIERELDDDTRFYDTYRRWVPSDRIRISAYGHLISSERTQAPQWADQVQPEIEARQALPGPGSTEALPDDHA